MAGMGNDHVTLITKLVFNKDVMENDKGVYGLACVMWTCKTMNKSKNAISPLCIDINGYALGWVYSRYY